MLSRRFRCYCFHVDVKARQQLVLDHAGLTKKAAAQIFARIKGHIELEELVAIGNVGLAEAANRYDASSGTSFATFAWYRVHGAMMDAVRKQTNLTRQTWATLNALRGTQEYLEHQGQKEAANQRSNAQRRTTAESLSEIKAAIAAIQTIHVVSFDAESLLEETASTAVPTAEVELDTKRVGRRLQIAMQRLTEREREILIKHYFEDKNLQEAGEEMGHSKSWASRLHASALERLRGSMMQLR